MTFSTQSSRFSSHAFNLFLFLLLFFANPGSAADFPVGDNLPVRASGVTPAEGERWQACREMYDRAQAQGNEDWEQVRDSLRFFITDYPDSTSLEEAYLKLALAHFHMSFHREALAYLNLFQERFPRSGLTQEVRYWQGRTKAEIGRPREAEALFRELAAGADQPVRSKALEALGDIHFAAGNFEEALILYEELLSRVTPYTSQYLELIRKAGFSHSRLGQEVACREHLYRYLNLAEDSPLANAVLFELGESYWRGQELDAARLFYARVVANGDPHDPPAVLSLFRQAQYRSLSAGDFAQGREEDDYAAAGDGPYLAVLDGFDRQPIAQDARYALLHRYLARMESERGFSLAKDYLRRAAKDDPRLKEVEEMVGQILIAQVESSLAAGDFRRVAALFQDENRHMLACRQGRLLYLVGQALEELGLYPQADEVYSLAMLQELPATEKADLEVRQAKVLLARNDLQAAEKLLAKARDSRRKHPQAGEIYHLSGRLREMQERKEEALSFYKEACRRAIPEVRAVICESKIKLLLRLGRLQEADDTLTKYQQQNLLETGWGHHLREEIGDSWRRLGHPEKAAAAYLLALGSGAPKGGKEAQSLHLRLGDSYLRMGQFKQALVHYQQALAGPDQLFRQSAEKGFRQAGIEQSLAELKPITRRVEPGGVNR